MDPDPEESFELEISDGLDGVKEDALTEEEFRKIYEDGEIRRFLHVFSSYVSEVKAMDGPDDPNTPGPNQRNGPSGETISQYIAQDLVEPKLPTARHAIAPFTLGRVRLTTQRLYLALQITYIPFLVSVYNFARWKNFGQSLACCTLFWILWWHNWVLPSLILWPVLFAVEKGLQPFTKAEELREYQEQIMRANEFGSRFSEGVSSSSTLDIKEMWRLLKLANNTRKLGSPKPKRSRVSASPSRNTEPNAETEETSTAALLADSDDKEYEQELHDLKRVALHVLTRIADFHERVQNIFLWRNSVASRRYITALTCILLATVLIPTPYLAKIGWFSVGIVFWHVTPIFDNLSTDGRSRIPPLFSDVPTDADYAMQLISRRVSAGQHILPPSSPKLVEKLHIRKKSDESHSKKPFYAKGIGEIGKLMSHEASRMRDVATEIGEVGGLSTSLHPVFANVMAIALPDASSEVYTYACQSGKTVGLITLTIKKLYFTPLLADSAKAEVFVEDISGVKKTGLLKGIQISWTDSSDPQPEKDLKFNWVTNRDELFARLVARYMRQQILLTLMQLEVMPSIYHHLFTYL